MASEVKIMGPRTRSRGRGAWSRFPPWLPPFVGRRSDWPGSSSPSDVGLPTRAGLQPLARRYRGGMGQLARTPLGRLRVGGAVRCVVPLVDGVRQARAVLWSATRGAAQLLAVGLLLGAVFRAPLAVLPGLLVVVAAATVTAPPPRAR